MNPTLAYRETEVGGASPMRLVILLYEQAIEDLRRAMDALCRGDIEARTREIKHALLVLGHLQGSLDPQQGGHVATNLARFYNQLRDGLLEAQCTQSPAGLELQIERLMQVHSAWCQAERYQAERSLAAADAGQEQPLNERPSASWKA